MLSNDICAVRYILKANNMTAILPSDSPRGTASILRAFSVVPDITPERVLITTDAENYASRFAFFILATHELRFWHDAGNSGDCAPDHR